MSRQIFKQNGRVFYSIPEILRAYKLPFPLKNYVREGIIPAEKLCWCTMKNGRKLYKYIIEQNTLKQFGAFKVHEPEINPDNQPAYSEFDPVTNQTFCYPLDEKAQQEKIIFPNSRFVPYKQYMKSEKWTAVRLQCFIRDNFTCRHCGRKGYPLNAHHTSYKRLGMPGEADDLITLCAACHKKEHERLNALAHAERTPELE